MHPLTLHRASSAQAVALTAQQADASLVEKQYHQMTPAVPLTPLLIDVKELAGLLSRSVPSLHRDDAAGRLPAALRLAGSKRWRYSEIVAWVEAGCPSRAQWNAMSPNRL
jgi:predicted DNA-binding transcriptional regulator AlpA